MSENKIPYKIYLEESEMPKAWYNVRADMKNKPAPLLNPGTHEPMTAEELGGVFCADLVAQELDNDNAYIEIPEEIREFYKMYRPSPLVRAYCLEEKLGTPAKIYYKLKATTPQAHTSLIPLSLRHITPRSRASRALPPRPEQDSGARLFQWLAHTSDLTVRYIW